MGSTAPPLLEPPPPQLISTPENTTIKACLTLLLDWLMERVRIPVILRDMTVITFFVIQNL
jgi:hypothetical protein